MFAIVHAGLATLALLIPAIPQETPSLLERDPEGWVDLLAEAGAELNGWTRLPIPPDGTLEPETQWVLDPESGILTCTGDKGHEWLRWDPPVKDGVLHVEWRFVPVTEGPDRYNSGVYVRNSGDGRVWHQAQTGGSSGGFLFAMTPVDGEITRVSTQEELTDQRVKPAGEWNVYEIVFDGPKIALWVNGAMTSTMRDIDLPAGHVGLEAEGYRIEFRKVLLKTKPE